MTFGVFSCCGCCLGVGCGGAAVALFVAAAILVLDCSLKLVRSLEDDDVLSTGCGGVG